MDFKMGDNDRIMNLQHSIRRANIDIELNELELKSYKMMKKGTLFTLLFGIITLLAIVINIHINKLDMDIINTCCISIVISTIVIQFNDLISIGSNIRKSNMHLEIKNRVLNDLRDELNNLYGL